MNWTLIVGMGVTGRATARHLRRRGVPFKVHDDDPAALDELPAFDGSWDGCDRVVASPGVRDGHPCLSEGSRRGLPVVCDLALAAEAAPTRIVAVTGTAGKTTLAFLIARVFEEAGWTAPVVGNSGRSPLDLLEQPAAQAWVVEVSSFQARRLGGLVPDVAVHLNLHPNHLDWHVDEIDYRLAKEALFAGQDASCHRILGPDVPSETLPGSATTWRLGGLQGWSWMRGFVVPSGHAPGEALEADHPDLFSDTIAAAAGVAFLNGIDKEAVRRALRAFAPLPHRYEVLGNFGGKRWINDSKSTSPYAALAALEKSPMPVVLLLGGSDKGLCYADLLRRAARLETRVVPFGEIGPVIREQALDVSGIVCDEPCTLEEAVRRASRAPTGVTVLLSPGSASFDAYGSYAERGDHFRSLVKSIGGLE